jgi:hypothetical protein
MKKFFVFVLFSLCAVSILTAQSVSKANLQNMYIGYLRSEGFSPYIANDFDGNIYFDDGNWRYWIIVNETTPNVFRLWLYYPYLGESWSSDKLDKAKSIFENASKIIKVEFDFYNTGEAGGWYKAELPLAKPEDFKHMFRTYLASITWANSSFYDILKSID